MKPKIKLECGVYPEGKLWVYRLIEHELVPGMVSAPVIGFVKQMPLKHAIWFALRPDMLLSIPLERR